MSDWLELELAEQLRPVEAPEELWERLQERRGVPRRHIPWMAIAAALAMMAVGALWVSAKGEVVSVRQLAGRAVVHSDSTCLACHTSI